MTAPAGVRGTAVFDVDGTLSTRDSLPALLRASLRHRPALVVALVGRLPRVAWQARTSASEAKELLLGAVLAGLPVAEVDAIGRTVAEHLVLSEQITAALEAHRSRGEAVWLASASVEPVIAAVATRVGADGYVGTRLEYRDGICTGRFAGPNCNHDEKLRRLDEVLPAAWRAHATAYSDSKADQPLMDAAAVSRWVRRGVLLD